MTVARTIELNLTPAELAALFCDLGSDEQAEFFNEIAPIAATWPGAGWCQQAHAIVNDLHLTTAGAQVLRSLAEHFQTSDEANQ